MSEPSFYPHPVERVEVHETRISWVFVAGERAYKVKKPIVLPFVDYGTIERRRLMCEEEVRLNRRLAPDAYLGVRPIVRDGGRFALGSDAHAESAVEFAVEMRRLPEDRTLARLLQTGELEPEQLRRVGRRLARFHAEAAAAPEEAGGPEPVSRMLDGEFESLLSLTGSAIDRRRLAAIERFTAAFVAAHSQELRERAAAGHFREGHGDLRLEHVVVDDGIRVFDCVEFDPALRQIDVAADLAFLVMELHAEEAGRMADVLVRSYRLAGGQPGDPALLSFYAAYRALVRVKLHYLDAVSTRLDDGQRRRARAEAGRFLTLVERFVWRARLPVVLVVCGVTASGKTEFARTLSHASGLPHYSSDPTRKQLAGVEPGARAPATAYNERFDRVTYNTLGQLARGGLAREGGAIVDATCRRAADRDAFREGFGPEVVPIIFVECVAPASVLAERAQRRSRERTSASDAEARHVREQLREFAPLEEVAPDRHLVLRTDRPTGDAIDDVQALLDARLAGMDGAQPGSG